MANKLTIDVTNVPGKQDTFSITLTGVEISTKNMEKLEAVLHNYLYASTEREEKFNISYNKINDAV